MPKSIFLLLCCFILLHTLAAAQSWYTTGQNADLMVSGRDFDHTGGWFNHPNGLATDGTRLLVCDRFNNRILVWQSAPAAAGVVPDLVLGQPDFISNNPGTGKNQLNWVGNASLASSGRLAVADTENDRILLWSAFPTTNGQAADVSLSLPALTNPAAGQNYAWPWGVWTDGQRVAAVATMGGALLFWNTWPTADNTPPDYTIKLAQFGTPRNISTDGSTYFFVGDHNAKVNGKPGTFFWNSYPTATNQPYDFYREEWIKGEKLPDGRLVAGGLSSIYIWNTMPISGTQNPDLTLRPDVYKNGDGVDVAYANSRMYINNYNGNNVLVYNDLPATSGQLPDFAIGSSAPAAQTLDSIYYVQNPVPVTDGKRLIVTSDFDRAIYIWDALPDHSGQPYDHRLQMPPNVPLWATVLHGKTLAVGARNTLSVWKDAAQISTTPSAMFIGKIGTATFDDIRGLAMDDQFFYLATQSGKLYVWQGFPGNNSQNPVLTLTSSSGGQFGFLYSDGVYLCAARPEPPTGVDIYRVADLAAGVTTPFKVINSGIVRINQASQAATFDGALAIACRGDHRVLLWPEVGDWGDPAKMRVLGQSAANTYDAGIGINRLFMPSTLLPRERELWIGEFKFSSRILKFSYGTTSTPEADAKTLAANVFPNPTTEQFTLEMDVSERDHYQMNLLDVLGRRLGELFSGELSAGEQFSRIYSAAQFGLASGVYFIQVSTSSGRRGMVKLVCR